jgi:hypothetical protein
MANIEDEIRSKTEAFANELAVLVRRAALEAAASALGGAAPAIPGRAARPRGRPRRAVAAAPADRVRPAPRGASAKPRRAAPAAKAAVSRKATHKRAPGEKRPPGELAKLTDKLGDYIKAHPGARMEAIGKALGTATKDLNLPIKKLLAAKKIRSQGHKRATEYFPA